MNKEQQIEEMAHILATTQREDHCGTIAPCQRDCPYYTLPSIDCEMGFCAEALYNAGYHKQVTGEWKLGKGGTMYSCSYCDYKAFPREVDEWTFCPRCGAKMKGE